MYYARYPLFNKIAEVCVLLLENWNKVRYVWKKYENQKEFKVSRSVHNSVNVFV